MWKRIVPEKPSPCPWSCPISIFKHHRAWTYRSIHPIPLFLTNWTLIELRNLPLPPTATCLRVGPGWPDFQSMRKERLTRKLLRKLSWFLRGIMGGDGFASSSPGFLNTRDCVLWPLCTNSLREINNNPLEMQIWGVQSSEQVKVRIQRLVSWPSGQFSSASMASSAQLLSSPYSAPFGQSHCSPESPQLVFPPSAVKRSWKQTARSFWRSVMWSLIYQQKRTKALVDADRTQLACLSC